MMKAGELQRKFYNSIEKRFENAGYDPDFVQDALIASDTYVFSESGCSGDSNYGECENVWDYIKRKYPRYKRRLKNDRFD